MMIEDSGAASGGIQVFTKFDSAIEFPTPSDLMNILFAACEAVPETLPLLYQQSKPPSELCIGDRGRGSTRSAHAHVQDGRDIVWIARHH
jgi:hypothetical protein